MGCCGQDTTGAGATAVDTGKRVNYTKGMLLGDADFVQEQAWHIARRHELSREVLGYGTVRGLKVGIDPGTARVRVSPGVACMPSGTPVCVSSDQCCDIDAWLARSWDTVLLKVSGLPQPHPLAVHVVLAYDSCLTDKVPVPGEPCRSEDQLTVESRIADCFKLELRLDPPYQVEEDAIRDFADWLAHVPVDSVSPPMDEQDFMDQLREAANAWLEPTSPHIGDFMFGSPPASLGSSDALLRAALRLWATELRPVWRARYGCGPNTVAPGDKDDAILLATLNPLVDVATRKVAGAVPIDETRRPVLMSLRMVQELIAQNPAPEPAHSVWPEITYGQMAHVGSDTAYARADHSHGTPPLPVLLGEVTGPITATTVTLLRGHGFSGAPVNGDVLALNAGGLWAPRPMPAAGTTVTAEQRFGLVASPGAAATTTFAKSDHTHGSPSLAGDAVTVDVGAVQEVRVRGLSGVPIDTTVALAADQVLGVFAQGTGFVWRPRALPGSTLPGAVLAQLQFGLSRSDGASAAYARADHSHGTPPVTGDATTITDTSGQKLRVTGLQGNKVLATTPLVKQVLTFNGTDWGPADPTGSSGPAPGTAPPPGLTFGGAGVVGTGTAYALANHSHGVPALPPLPALAGDVVGAPGDNVVQRLQKVPVRPTKPKKDDLLVFDGDAWTPRAPPAVELMVAGNLTIRTPAGTVTTAQGIASNDLRVKVLDGNASQVAVEVEVLGVTDAQGPRSRFAVQLTPVWNSKLPIMAFVDTVRAASATSVTFVVVIFSSQGLLGQVHGVHFEVQRFAPLSLPPV